MSIRSTISPDNETLEICVEGAFDFNLLNAFRDAYRDNPNDQSENHCSHYIVNMRATSSIDSSALGMLLNMKRELGKNDRDIHITHCQPQILKILTISRFDKKFTIE